MKLKTFQESEHSAAECTGIVGELISSFDIGINDPEKSRWIFKLKTDMPMGKTGKFGAQVWVDSIDTFDGPWESITNQCSLDASVNQKFSATAVIKVKVSCNPKQIANPFFGEDKLTLENFEFAGEFPIEQ